MKKLENIPKKNIHKVPEGYFDNLPSLIQARVTQHTPVTRQLSLPRVVFKYVLPFVVIGVLSVLWFSRENTAQDAETILSSIQTEQLIEYLTDSDLTLDELLGSADFTPMDVSEIESNVYDLQLGNDELEDYLDDYELDLKN